MNTSYDVIVVGGGHAGTEAAAMAARMGSSVLLVTSNLETIGQMSCNPAVGGIAKGTVAREVDALGGVMGRATDRATIQFRMLNRSKGPAVWSPRAQCDRGLYRRAVRSELERFHRISFLQGTVRRLLTESGGVSGVETETGVRIGGRAVVLTAGTFLRGRIHIGTETRIDAGRAGDSAVVHIAEQLEQLGLRAQRFKTGTPPRIDGRSVDFDQTTRQDGDDDHYRFSVYQRHDRPTQLPCWITYSGEELQEIVTANLSRSALYGGEISGRGPRYCPSIEDKIVRFPDARRHQIFLEPEGLATSELYVNGLSTSLPADVQLQFLHSVPGLENARMTRAGYAIEYDYYPPEQLTSWLEVKTIERLFLAGQINGTTGYEEAAGQGAVAGINASRRVNDLEPVVFTRDSSYIGVLIDDLVTKGVDEPYRLFTSRAEFRLLLRQDNAVFRLAPLAAELGMLEDQELRELERRTDELNRINEVASTTTATPDQAARLLESTGQAQLKEPQRLTDILRRPGVSAAELFAATGLEVPDEEVLQTAEIEIRYAGYIEREKKAAAKLSDMAAFELPRDIDYLELSALSTEARHKLAAVQPESLAQAGRIPGVSPSDLQNLVFAVLRGSKPAA